MNPTALARAFQDHKLIGPEGALTPRRALLTRKSLLLFSDDLVLKLRRPRAIDGYDQSLMSVRYAMTARERWIGRQLNSGAVYLEDCVLRLDDDYAKVVLHRGLIEGEPLVLMRRLPDESRADVLLPGVAPARARALLDLAMRRLAAFHIQAEHHGGPPFGEVGRAAQRFAAVLAEVAPELRAGERERLEQETGAWLEALEPTMRHRILERRMRSVHGELRMEHLFLGGEAVAFIDPNDGHDSERAVDTAEEVMSLALELDVVLGQEISDQVVETYASETADGSLRRVARFYKRFGCLRRAVAALRDTREPETEVAEARASARFFIERALAL